MTPVELLGHLLGHPERVEDVPVAAVPAVLVELAGVQSALAARLAAGTPLEATSGDESLLKIAEAAKRLGVSPTWLYRRAKRLPFVVRLDGHLRFSALGIDRYLRARQGR